MVRKVREETGLSIEALQPIWVRDGVAVHPSTGAPKLHVEIVWRARLKVPAPASEGRAEHPWRFFRPVEIPPEVYLPPRFGG